MRLPPSIMTWLLSWDDKGAAGTQNGMYSHLLMIPFSGTTTYGEVQRDVHIQQLWCVCVCVCVRVCVCVSESEREVHTCTYETPP